MVQTRVVLGFILLGGFIVVPRQCSVKQWLDGSPMPIPKPTAVGSLLADGSPMPIPKPTALAADGSPMPIPKPTAEVGPAA
jgi:hypothetical protein